MNLADQSLLNAQEKHIRWQRRERNYRFIFRLSVLALMAVTCFCVLTFLKTKKNITSSNFAELLEELNKYDDLDKLILELRKINDQVPDETDCLSTHNFTLNIEAYEMLRANYITNILALLPKRQSKDI